MKFYTEVDNYGLTSNIIKGIQKSNDVIETSVALPKDTKNH